jgi:RNA 2',3'-cyclic 3'-phosphodiesterase
MDSIRTFIAVPVPEAVRAQLASAAADVFGDIPTARPVLGGSIHATLKFLGDISPDLIAKLDQGLKLIAKKHASFRLHVRGVGGFPDMKFPRVVYAAVVGEIERMTKLAADIDALTSSIGIEPEKKPYTPHLTLARIKAQKQMGLLRKKMEVLQDRDFGALPVEEIVLYRSELLPHGARYTPLAGAKLAK